MKNLKTYFFIAKLQMENMIAYRVQVWSYMLMQCLIMVSIGFFWQSVYGSADSAFGVTSAGMVTYTVVSALMSSLYYMGVEDRIADAVKSGSIATDMIKPINLFTLYFAEDIGNIVINFFQATLPIFLVGSLLFGLPAPASSQHFLLFLLSFALGYGINWTFSAIFAMVSFSAISLGPAFAVKYHFVNLLSGAIVPIWFFPKVMRTVLNYLPFVHMYQTPLAIYIGKTDMNQSLRAVAIQLVWLALLSIAFLFAQRRATKRVLVQGG